MQAVLFSCLGTPGGVIRSTKGWKYFMPIFTDYESAAKNRAHTGS